MEQKYMDPPEIYAIWAEARPDGPLRGQSGFLSEDGHRLFFTEREDAEQKTRDLRNLCLNRSPAAAYHCTEYPGEHDVSRDLPVERIKPHDLRPDLETLPFEVERRIYGDTGGGFMVGTLAVHFPDLDKTVWINCDAEGVTLTSADYVWNEDHSDSWERYEDVVMLELNFRDARPKDAGPLYPAIQEAVAYTIQRETQRSSRPFRVPAKWLPGTSRQGVDPMRLKRAVEQDCLVEVGHNGAVIHDEADSPRFQRQAGTPAKVVYIASPLSGEIEQNLRFARQACRYAIAEGTAPFAPHLLYTQMLDDTDPEERQAGIDMGKRILERCDELWLCGDRISPGMAEEKEFAESLGIPVRSVSAEEIQGMELSPAKGMEMTMG